MLILVIALLVLMALIGTAYMSMAQVDRATSIQHSNNNEIELLMDGLANILKGTLTVDVINQGKYRPRHGYNTATVGASTYQNYTGVGPDTTLLSTIGATGIVNPGSPYLATRAPQLQNEVSITVPNGLIGPNNQPTWSYITAPLIGGKFSSPVPPIGAPFLYGQLNYDYLQRNVDHQHAAGDGQPSAAGSGEHGRQWRVNPGVGESHHRATVAAADADGDGVPDSGFIKLPMGSINGLTYYAAFRIVDSSSAINVNTAWQHNPQHTNGESIGGGTASAASLPGDFSPSSIDLSFLATGG